MRRVFPLFLLTLTPLLANCADSVTPVAPVGPSHSEEESAPTQDHVFTEAEWYTADEWWTPGGAIALAEPDAEGEISAQAAPGSQPVIMVMGRRDPTPGAPPGLYKAAIRPHSVTIPAGTKVTFQGTFVHRLAIYGNGQNPNAIPDANPGAFMLYPYNRLFLQPAPTPAITLTFLAPGKYLVLCAIKTHFFQDKQWAWVHVTE